MHQYLERQPYSWEIIVVSNGCTDSTDDVVREAATWLPSLRLISLQRKGKGIALKTGALETTGRIVFICDADLSMPPESLESFLRMAETMDVVAGSREAPGARRFDEPWHRHLMGRVFNRLVQVLAVPGINDTQCGFKAFRRNAADRLFSQQTVTGFGFDVELLYLARKYGYRVEELPIEWHFDPDTRVRPGIDTINMVGELLLIRLHDLRGRYGRPVPAPTAGGDHA